jgi:tripartite-type tricarboxylate transporter receptor subunit TctC
MKARLVGALALGMAASAAAPQAMAQSAAAEFFRGKQMEFIIGSDTGGGFDAYGRAVARFITKQLPGNPAMVPKNMPGAGSLKALQYVDRIGPKDGTTLGILNPSILTVAATDPSKIDVDLNKLQWLGNLSSDNKVCLAWGKSGLTSMNDLKTKKFRIGGTTINAGSYPPAAILKHFFPDTVQNILGYPGNAQTWLAMETGEVDGHCTGWGIIPTQKPDWVRDKKVNVLVKFTKKEIPGLTGVPTIYDLPMDQATHDAIAFIAQGDEITRPIFVGPGVPADRVAVLRDAFEKMLKDPEFLDYAKLNRLDLDTMGWKELTDTVKQITGTPAAALTVAKKFVE